MRSTAQVDIRADDPIAARELEALASEHGWNFAAVEGARFLLIRPPFVPGQ